MAFVVVTHLHPGRESHLAELLQRRTQMPTMQVTQRVKLKGKHVYVIPRNRSRSMTDTRLDTREFNEPHGRRTPINDFLRSMAASGHQDPIMEVIPKLFRSKEAGVPRPHPGLRFRPGRIRLAVSDEGAGFDTGAATNGQGGLMNVRHRLSLMGCQMQIRTGPGKGTRVTIDIPGQQVR